MFLVIGTSGLTLTRVQTLLEHGAHAIVFTDIDLSSQESVPAITSTISAQTSEKLGEFSAAGKISWVQDRGFTLSDLETQGRSEVRGVVDGVFLTIPKAIKGSSSTLFVDDLFHKCVSARIPINTADDPEHCTFTLLSTFTKGDFQLGVTTSGKGCRLANRIRREAVSSLPNNIDAICEKVGALRRRIIAEDEKDEEAERTKKLEEDETGQEDDDADQTNKFNNLVLEFNESHQQKKKQRLRWLSQIVEYYPLAKLADLSVDELSKEYKQYNEQTAEVAAAANKRGRIALVGAGPGSTGLLTTEALQAIKEADIILADKLVPAAVLAQIPRETPVHIAKKFPGNAERAQQELLALGLEGVRAGKYVVRLKQGDPYIFGRGAEEYLYFEQHGYAPTSVVAGITSALSAPLAARIPPTHRDVADQVLVCTGTGRRGALPRFPEWDDARTVVFLMALHRIGDVVDALVAKGWDPEVPCCVVERASCPDQRVIRTRLKDVAEALETAGSRPPGLLVAGRACEVIVKLADDERWRIEEGL